jgi:hypothetical protein
MLWLIIVGVLAFLAGGGGGALLMRRHLFRPRPVKREDRKAGLARYQALKELR